MNKNILSLFLVPAILANILPVSTTYAAASPEDRCFDLLTSKAQNNPAFAGLDLTKVRKTNGKNTSTGISSGEFSVATYNDFKAAFNREIPAGSGDIVHYPDDMNRVSSNYKFKRKIHKANRNNAATIMYNNGNKTNIDQWAPKDGKNPLSDIRKYFSGKRSASYLDGKYHRQKIDGHYVNSKYVTFGRDSRLAFSYPSRSPNPADDGFFPTGRPVLDMREYVMYTHHLSSAYGGKFMSCGLVKMVPQGQYKLQNYTAGDKSVAWANFGGTRMSESNVRTQSVGGNDFRLGEIEYTITDRESPTGRLMRFKVLSLGYKNGSPFMNPYITMDLFDKAMKDAHNTSKNFLEMRRAFYDRVIASGLGIGATTALAPPPTPPGGATPPPTPPASPNLYLSNHTEKNCTDDGGTVVAAGLNNLCSFSRGSCVSGWSKAGNWSVTTSKSCGNCSSQPCITRGGKGNECTAWGPVDPGTCTTASHGWSNTASETCTAKIGTTSNKGENSTCSNTTCRANVTQTGCY